MFTIAIPEELLTLTYTVKDDAKNKKSIMFLDPEILDKSAEEIKRTYREKLIKRRKGLTGITQKYRIQRWKSHP